MSESHRQIRTIDVEPDEHMLIKPGELIDIVELSPLTLQDRRIYNLLILNAWDSITGAKEHHIHKRDLRGSHNVNDREHSKSWGASTAPSTCSAEVEVICAAWAERIDGYAKVATPVTSAQV